MKVKPLLLAAILAVASCKSAAHRPSVGLMATPPPNGRVIGFDPSVVGLPGAISDTVYDSAGIISWVKFGPLNTDWRPVPVSQFVTGDPSQAPGLKAPIGFVVTMNDGSASWIKSTSGDTGWVTNPVAGGGGAGIVDGGVQAPLAGFGSLVSPLKILAATPTDGGYMTAAQAGVVARTPANWYAGVLAFIESKDATINNPLWTAEMTPNPGAPEVEFGSVAGTGSTFLSTTIEGGVLVSQSGATAGSSQLCRNKNGAVAASPQETFCANMRTSHYAIATRAIVVQTGTTGILHLAGMTDELVNHILLGYVGTTSTANWTAEVFTVFIDTGVAKDTNYHDFLFIADGTNITFYIGDGTGGNFAQVAQIAQSNAGTNPGHWVGYCENGASGGGNVQHIDKAMAVGVNGPS